MISLVSEKLWEVLKAVAPLIAAVVFLQFALVQAPLGLFLQFLLGSVLAVTGMVLLFIGIDLGILPIGRFIGAELPARGSLALIIAVAFSVGFATTIAEPDVLVFASQVTEASPGTTSQQAIVYAIASGVGVFAAFAMMRIITGWPIRYILGAAYSIVIVLSFFAPAEFVPVAYDAGSVTTGVLSAPVIIALAIGLSSVLAGRSAVSDGFGLLGFASIGPIIVILIAGIWLR